LVYVVKREHPVDTEIDAFARLPQHGNTMSEKDLDNARRSTRVFMRVRVVVAGKNSDNRRFREACETIVISAHGGLLYLNQPLDMDAMLVVTNPFTQEEQESRIVFIGDATNKGQRIGIEFLTPAPHFWGVDFVPMDWPAPPATVRSH
jgi:hypothetical protein